LLHQPAARSAAAAMPNRVVKACMLRTLTPYDVGVSRYNGVRRTAGGALRAYPAMFRYARKHVREIISHETEEDNIIIHEAAAQTTIPRRCRARRACIAALRQTPRALQPQTCHRQSDIITNRIEKVTRNRTRQPSRAAGGAPAAGNVQTAAVRNVMRAAPVISGKRAPASCRVAARQYAPVMLHVTRMSEYE